jgi:hypothetical protein
MIWGFVGCGLFWCACIVECGTLEKKLDGSERVVGVGRQTVTSPSTGTVQYCMFPRL